nr:LPD1 domain-containing protein [Reinekea sp. G2M2-21]
MEQKHQLLAFHKIVSVVRNSIKYVACAQKITAQKGGRKYWDLPEELMARAFEAFIEDTITSDSNGTKWLVTGTTQDDYPDNTMHPYPIGKERIEINQAFKRLLPYAFGMRLFGT